jgi:hypothetical protein
MKKKFALAIAIMALLGVLATSIGSAIENLETPITSAFYTFKYFTMQSNLLVALFFFVSLSKRASNSRRYQNLLGAVVVFISITFIVFLTMLSSIWYPTGLTMVGNIFNHYIVPITTISFLVIYRKDYNFNKKDIFHWLIYPLIYITFLLINGIITTDFIYPFFDINELGFGYFLVTFMMIIALFFLFSFGTLLLTKKSIIVEERE